MPSYLSHISLAKDIYKKIPNQIEYTYFLTYSLGCDLSKYSKCRQDTHKIKQEEFINNMLNYIKENNLTNNKKILAVLYGHISHYIMDSTIHPLVKIISKNTIGNNKHTQIENYYNYYLQKDKLNITTKIPKEVRKMLNNVYYKTYHTKNITMYYKFNLILYKLLFIITKIFNINFLKKITKLNKYLKDNKEIDLLNNNHLLYKYSFDELYIQSIEKTIKYIKNIDL